MITVVKAERGRLTIRGVKHGQRYVVQTVPEGWFVIPVPEKVPSRRPRTWPAPKRPLTELLDALAKDGLQLRVRPKPPVKPCRF